MSAPTTLAAWMRKMADRIDHAGAPKLTEWTFTFENRRGLVFRTDGRGCRVAYLGDAAYELAHSESGGILAPDDYAGSLAPSDSLRAANRDLRHDLESTRQMLWLLVRRAGGHAKISSYERDDVGSEVPLVVRYSAPDGSLEITAMPGATSPRS